MLLIVSCFMFERVNIINISKWWCCRVRFTRRIRWGCELNVILKR